MYNIIVEQTYSFGWFPCKLTNLNPSCQNSKNNPATFWIHSRLKMEVKRPKYVRNTRAPSALRDLFLCLAVFFLVVVGVLLLTMAVSCYCQCYSGEGCLQQARNHSCTTQAMDFYFEEIPEENEGKNHSAKNVQSELDYDYITQKLKI